MATKQRGPRRITWYNIMVYPPTGTSEWWAVGLVLNRLEPGVGTLPPSLLRRSYCLEAEIEDRVREYLAETGAPSSEST